MTDFNDIFEKEMQDMNAKIKKISDEVKEKTQSIFAEVVKPFFDKYPDIYGIGWNQFTPHWNDGEECTFSVGEIYLYLTEEQANDDPNCHGNHEIADLSSFAMARDYVEYGITPKHSWYTLDRCKQIIEDYRKIYEQFPNYDEIVRDFEKTKTAMESIEPEYYEMVFGDHVTVLLDKEHIYTEEHEHE